MYFPHSNSFPLTSALDLIAGVTPGLSYLPRKLMERWCGLVYSSRQPDRITRGLPPLNDIYDITPFWKWCTPMTGANCSRDGRNHTNCQQESHTNITRLVSNPVQRMTGTGDHKPWCCSRSPVDRSLSGHETCITFRLAIKTKHPRLEKIEWKFK